MSYMTKEKAKTYKDKKLAVEHLMSTISLDKEKAQEHAEVQDKEGYDKKYNKAHEKAHKKDVKGAQKLVKKYKKSMGSYNSDTVNKAIESRGGG